VASCGLPVGHRPSSMPGVARYKSRIDQGAHLMASGRSLLCNRGKAEFQIWAHAPLPLDNQKKWTDGAICPPAPAGHLLRSWWSGIRMFCKECCAQLGRSDDRKDGHRCPRTLSLLDAWMKRWRMREESEAD
jgi:hypothetical protein